MKYLKLFEQYVGEKLIAYPGYDGVELTGFVDGKQAKLNYIKVKPQDRGAGIGKKAVTDFEKWAKSKGAKYVEIDAYKKSIPFWQKLDYEIEKEFPIIHGYKQNFKPGKKEL